MKSASLFHELYPLTVWAILRGLESLGSDSLRRGLASIIGLFTTSLPRRKKDRILAHLREAYPDRSEEWIHGVFLLAQKLIWMNCFDLTKASRDTEIVRRARTVGIDYLEKALEAGSGAILWESNAFGRRNLAKKILCSHGIKVWQVHSEQHLPALQGSHYEHSRCARTLKSLAETMEGRFLAGLVQVPADESLSYLRQLAERLDCNQVLCSAIDGRMGAAHSEIQFLGRHWTVPNGMVSLSRLTGAALLSLFCYEDRDGLVLEITPPIAAPRTLPRNEFARAALTEGFRNLEQRVLAYPGQFLNWQFA